MMVADNYSIIDMCLESQIRISDCLKITDRRGRNDEINEQVASQALVGVCGYAKPCQLCLGEVEPKSTQHHPVLALLDTGCQMEYQ